ncbi:phage tail spike protein [Clostridium perfringens]|uniref:phage tail spike protein n=1 Tax=Clostridium perfringens TaxID=1502 RepID=UPI0013E3612A|nr:phage tail spike protein [Clostridium perfringens]NGT74859.1 MBL fold metallo-hydrolase [Clostridium perfringens]
MLKLKDKNKKLVAGLINYKDLCIESILATGDKKLSFSLPKEDKFYNFIEEEGYIETKTQEYVIKAKDVGVDYTRFDCVLNLETLEANIFDRFESVEQTITNALNLAIVGTGWTVKANTLKKKRTVRCTNKNALEIVQEIKKTYRVDIVFNTLSKQIEVYEHLGEDKGAYFIDSLNLTALQVQSDSYKFATRIIAEGKDGLTFEDINKGKNYVENFQYSKKIKTIYWKDERYTIKESLLEDARAKLEEISKPFVSYNASILNLAELNPKYKNILDYQLGDTITLLSKNNKVKDKQRIVKTLEYPQDHSRDTVELANAVLKFEDIQQENQETTNTVSNITVDNGTIDGSTIDGIKVNQIDNFKANVVEAVNLKAINANIDNLHVNKADIQDLHAVTAKIGTLEATKADITQLNAVNADISNLNAIKANITELNAANGKIDVLESKTASIDNLLAGNLTANNFKANSITANSGIIAEGAIGSGQISSLTANKINAGTIDLSLVTVAGPNGRLRLQGNKLQIMDNKDGKLYERIMLGVDSNNNSSLVLRGADGKTILLNQDGLTKAGITEGFNKIDDNSIDASLIFDKNSMVRNINGATETIRGTRVQIGDRTLDVELSTQKNTITEHSKELSTQKASLTALDNALKFKVDEQVYRDSINTINNNISTTNSNLSKATTELKLLKGKVDLKVNKIDIDKTVKEIEDKIKVTTDKITTVESKLTQENNSIKASVQDLNSTTQTITTNISNISKDLTSKINSNLDAAKSFATDIAIAKATIAKEDAINVASLDATSKSSNALNAAKNYIDLEVKTINTKVHNLESGIDILKDQIKSKVSQSDIDKSITTVDDKIKVLSSNISDVSSSVTQLRDSVTTEINSINSKTHSIETNLGEKASKQEITEVDSKVTTIKADLSSITQRVSNSEVKTNKLNDNIQNLSSRMSSAEQKITPGAIINTVSSTIDTKVNSIKNEVNDKINESDRALSNLKNEMNGSFKDGVLTEAEKKDLEKQLTDLEVERNNVLSEVDSLMKVAELQNTNQLVALNNAKKEFIDNHFNLINAIRRAISLAPIAKPSVPNVSIFRDIKLHYPHFSNKYYPAYPDLSVIENHNGEVYLIDGGENCNKYDVERYLNSKNIFKIDKIFITHSHSDHIGSMEYLIDKFGCKELYCKTPNWNMMPAIELGEWKTKELHEKMIAKARSIGAKIIELNSDRKIQLTDKSDIWVYNTQNNNYSNYNNISLGFLFRYYYNSKDAVRYFIQGDMSYSSEDFVGGQNIGKVDILKLGHHGNVSSNGETWLSHLRPGYSVATLGYPPGNQVKLNTMRCKFVNSKVYLPNDNKDYMSITINKDTGAITTTAIEHQIKNEWYQRDNKDWYYFKEDGTFTINQTLIIKDRKYRFDGNGKCINPGGEAI